MLTAERLRELLRYDATSGAFTWKQPGKGRRHAAGCTSKTSGYVSISIDYKIHYAHRLAWLYVTGEWPTDQIDHINGIRRDNAFANLRAATPEQNNVNRKAVRGYWFDRNRGKFCVTISVDDKNKNFGRFDTVGEARRAYLAARADISGIQWLRRPC